MLVPDAAWGQLMSLPTLNIIGEMSIYGRPLDVKSASGLHTSSITSILSSALRVPQLWNAEEWKTREERAQSEGE